MAERPRRLPVAGRPGAPLRELLEARGLTPGADPEPLLGQVQARNRAEAAAVLRAGLERLGGRLDALHLEPAELERRLTLASRALDEAARHPDPELRLALGVCAARVLVEAPGEVSPLDVVELLGRLGALEYALLDVVVSAGVVVHDRLPAARAVVGDPLPGLALEPEPRELPSGVRRPEELARVLAAHFRGVGPEQVRQASRRLRRLGLFHPEHAYGDPAPAGREVLRLSRAQG